MNSRSVLSRCEGHDQPDGSFCPVEQIQRPSTVVEFSSFNGSTRMRSWNHGIIVTDLSRACSDGRHPILDAVSNAHFGCVCFLFRNLCVRCNEESTLLLSLIGWYLSCHKRRLAAWTASTPKIGARFLLRLAALPRPPTAQNHVQMQS